MVHASPKFHKGCPNDIISAQMVQDEILFQTLFRYTLFQFPDILFEV